MGCVGEGGTSWGVGEDAGDVGVRGGAWEGGTWL